MFKKLMAVSVIAAMPAIAMAGAPTISGYADITYTQDTKTFAADAEVNVVNDLSKEVTVRLDVDLIDGNANLEQVNFAYTPIKGITVIGGVFNSPVGWEKHDAPDMYSISKGLAYGNNVNDLAGVAVAGAVGPATITVAAINDPTKAEETAFAAIVNASAMKGLDIELGYVKVDATDSDLADANITYKGMGATVGLEYLMHGNDSTIGTMINYEISPMFNVTGRYDMTSYDAGGDNTTQYIAAVTFNAAKNLAILAEYKGYSLKGADTDTTATLEFIASF